MVAVMVVPFEFRFVTLIGVPLPPEPAWVNQTWLPVLSKFVPVTVIVLPLIDTPVIRGLLPDMTP